MKGIPFMNNFKKESKMKDRLNLVAPCGIDCGICELYLSRDNQQIREALISKGILENVKNNSGEVINPKTSIGEYGFVGHFVDSEGNRIGLHSHK